MLPIYFRMNGLHTCISRNERVVVIILIFVWLGTRGGTIICHAWRTRTFCSWLSRGEMPIFFIFFWIVDSYVVWKINLSSSHQTCSLLLALSPLHLLAFQQFTVQILLFISQEIHYFQNKIIKVGNIQFKKNQLLLII